MSRKEKETSPPKCWIYNAGNGWKIYAGKTDEDNDILSTAFARPDEYWFHVNGAPGSHVILRKEEDAPEDQDKPDKKLIELAASVAAFHSKARNGGWTSVSYTLARNVSKPRGSKPGLVQIRDDKNLRVKPGLPDKL